MSKELHIVGFRVGREVFGVPIALVHEIVRVPEITSVPDSPGFVQGVINLRGKIVSVVDLRRRFGEKDIKPTKKNRILVTEVHGKLVGLIVDSASEVLKIPESDIELPPVFDQGELNYVTGVGKLNGRLIILIDLNRILQKGELRRVGEVGNGWFGVNVTQDDAKTKIERMRQYAQAAGCDPGKLHFTVSAGIGAPVQLDQVKRYRDAGVHQVIVGSIPRDSKTVQGNIERLAEQIVAPAAQF
jgi:purine-binding chemotaxis protein CheW